MGDPDVQIGTFLTVPPARHDQALEAVQALHARRVFHGDGYGWEICAECRQTWPCATERAITDALVDSPTNDDVRLDRLTNAAQSAVRYLQDAGNDPQYRGLAIIGLKAALEA